MVDKKTKETYVYRIMPLEYFLQALDKRSWYLPKISRWDDVYELFLLKQRFIDSKGVEKSLMVQAENFYGLCWSTARDSDALWRMYSSNKMSVRVKTTVSRIVALCDKLNGSNGLCFMSGDVTYKTEKSLADWIKALPSPFKLNGSAIIESLFIKRNSFDHEKEYRIIGWQADFDEQNHVVCHSDHVDMPFNPTDFILEVSLDPRLSPQEMNILKPALSIRLGGKCRVSQSTLYHFKQYTLSIL